MIRPFILRRTRAAVAPELPARVEVVHTITLSDAERALYEATRRNALQRLADEPDAGRRRFQLLGELQRLRQLASRPWLTLKGAPASPGQRDLAGAP